ncbi:hypothetical protein [Variovorax sp. ZT5P30]
MEYTPDRIIELVSGIDWKDGNVLRIFWVRCSMGSRAELAESVRGVIDGEAVVPLVVRGPTFLSANAVLADVHEIFDENKSEFEKIDSKTVRRVTALLLAKDDFRMPQGGSPITLPDWFPVLPGRETFFHIADLGLAAEERMLDCADARIEQVSKLTFELEASIVGRLSYLLGHNRTALQKFMDTAHGGPVPDCVRALDDYQRNLDAVLDQWKYRPNAATDATSLVSRLLKLTLNNSPKQLGAFGKTFASCFDVPRSPKLKPTFFAAMLRPAAKMDDTTANWHAIMLAFYQAYQLMNGAAHAGEYPRYSVALQFANSVNLRTFLLEAREHVDLLT